MRVEVAMAPRQRKYITVAEFDELWDVGRGRRWPYWNPTGQTVEHPAVCWTDKVVKHFCSVDAPLIVLLRTRGGVVVAAGCRRFTFEEAKAHWEQRALFGGREQSVTARARYMLSLLPGLKARAKRRGWKL